MNLKNIHNIYFIGIGGIGMSALAHYFHTNGKHISGYDKVHGLTTDALEAQGVKINYEDEVSNIEDIFLDKDDTLVVYTPAIPKDHKQFNYFKENQFKIFKRSEILGEITKNTFCFAVAGTHGKTTTSTILGHILTECGINATSFLGGISENYNSNLILGGDEISVVEADEFDRSFLRLSPNIACITSMDADHLDIYGESKELEASFRDFSRLVLDDIFVKKGLPITGITYGLEEDADYTAKNIRIKEGSYYIDVFTPTQSLKNIEIMLPGKHNVLNTLVALAMAHHYGVKLQNIARALKTFKGIKRRFNFKIKTKDLVLIDDYAHHPTEINAVSNAVRELYPEKSIAVVFQPHLYSRTKDFIDDFAKSLEAFDEVFLLDIYPARELPIEGVTSSWLLSKINLVHKRLVKKENLEDEVLQLESKVIVMLGAGDIGELVDPVKEVLLKKAS